mmetsp:Transcript_20258/g.43415  ORF Transcript_20258/g.43415 Transcript_20258/m.43415 type:complete len:531 (+) Transcript_20258:54-1646(+)
MSADDTLFPDSVKDFVFDLHDAARRSFIPSEQQPLYVSSFREITAKYFPNTAWPSPAAISSECGGDPLFLALYDELTLRHLQSVKRPSVRDRVEGWHAYRRLFDLLLDEAPDEEGGRNAKVTLYLVPEWCFDILHEFLYQFQGFCQFRTSTYAAAAKAVESDPEKGPASHTADALDVLGQHRDAWAVETVLYYLHRLVSVGTRSKDASATYRFLAYFSSVTLSRLECLLGDYRASVAALEPIYDPKAAPVAVGEDMKTPEELVNGVFPARLSLDYHAGMSYLMLRRYKDSASVLGSICLFMQRGFKTGQLRKIPGSEQFNKLYDRMIALLAILSHICPVSVVDDNIASVVHGKHANTLSKIESGEEGYEDLFIFACPKFVNPAVPDYSQALKPGCPAAPYGQDAYKLQVQHFMNEMAAHASLRKMRSYMTLYTSIEVEKLASFNDMKAGEFEPWLTCFKHKMRQLERGTAEGAAGDKVGTAMDIHYNVAGNVVHVDEAEKTRRFETFFMKQIKNNDDILRQLENIKIELH